MPERKRSPQAIKFEKATKIVEEIYKDCGMELHGHGVYGGVETRDHFIMDNDVYKVVALIYNDLGDE